MVKLSEQSLQSKILSFNYIKTNLHVVFLSYELLNSQFLWLILNNLQKDMKESYFFFEELFSLSFNNLKLKDLLF